MAGTKLQTGPHRHNTPQVSAVPPLTRNLKLQPETELDPSALEEAEQEAELLVDAWKQDLILKYRQHLEF